jgi:hypothetical protein
LNFLKVIAASIIVIFVLPMSFQATLALSDHLLTRSQAGEARLADMSSTGLLPAAEDQRAARVVVMSVPLSGWPGRFLTHSWVAYKRANAPAWMRYEVLGYASRDSAGELNGKWLDNQPSLNRYPPDGRWFGKTPVVIADVEGATADLVIPKIEAVVANYEETAGHYRTWPGPNSNTFVAAVLRASPELKATLPPTAVGKDFRRGPFLSWTDSRTGIELNLYGILGIKVGRVEEVEVNLFTLVAGTDLRQHAIKLPGVGIVGLDNLRSSRLEAAHSLSAKSSSSVSAAVE